MYHRVVSFVFSHAFFFFFLGFSNEATLVSFLCALILHSTKRK